MELLKKCPLLNLGHAAIKSILLVSIIIFATHFIRRTLANHHGGHRIQTKLNVVSASDEGSDDESMRDDLSDGIRFPEYAIISIPLNLFMQPFSKVIG